MFKAVCDFIVDNNCNAHPLDHQFCHRILFLLIDSDFYILKIDMKYFFFYRSVVTFLGAISTDKLVELVLVC